MPHGLRTYKALLGAQFERARAIAIGSIIAEGRSAVVFDRNEKVNDLCDAGFTEEQSEIITEAVACCFLSERFKQSFSPSNLKFRLVRSGLSSREADAFLDSIDACVLSGRNAEVRAPIPHVPAAGKVVMCDFSFLSRPEMQKQRRAIVVSKRLSSLNGRCCVVPVSMHATNANHPLHHEFGAASYPFFSQDKPVWAVCDHVYTVGLGRLWQVNVGRRPGIPSIANDDLAAIRKMLGTAFGA